MTWSLADRKAPPIRAEYLDGSGPMRAQYSAVAVQILLTRSGHGNLDFSLGHWLIAGCRELLTSSWNISSGQKLMRKKYLILGVTIIDQVLAWRLRTCKIFIK